MRRVWLRGCRSVFLEVKCKKHPSLLRLVQPLPPPNPKQKILLFDLLLLRCASLCFAMLRSAHTLTPHHDRLRGHPRHSTQQSHLRNIQIRMPLVRLAEQRSRLGLESEIVLIDRFEEMVGSAVPVSIDKGQRSSPLLFNTPPKENIHRRGGNEIEKLTT